MIIKHKDVLRNLILETDVKKFVEVGVWKSHLVKHLLKSACKDVLEEYWAIDQWTVLGPEHGRMARRTVGDWHSMYIYCCKLMTYFPQLRVIRCTSLEGSALFAHGYFDMVFIDSSHFYDQVIADIKSWMLKVRSGGLLVGHDYGIGRRKNHRVKEAVDYVFGEGAVEVREDGVWIKEI